MSETSEAFESEERPAPAEPLTAQEMVELFARKAKPRLQELLRIRGEHLFDATPGHEGSSTLTERGEVKLKVGRTSQPYKDIHRFANDEHVIGFVVNPGLVPIVKAMTIAMLGKKLLVTRALGPTPKGAVSAPIEGYGVRVLLRHDEDQNETTITWEWLFGAV